MDCFTCLAEFSKRIGFHHKQLIHHTHTSTGLLGHRSLQFFLRTFLFQTCEHWWLRFLAALLLVCFGINCTSDDSSSFQNSSLVPQSTLQFCLTKCLLAEISRCGFELLPATLVPRHFAGQCWLTVCACSATLGPFKPPWVPQSTSSKLFQERRPLTDSLKPY